MKKFKFQLETLLRVTRRKKEDAEVAFANANRALDDARAGLRELMDAMQRGQREYEAIVEEGKHVTVGRLRDFNAFFAWKREQIAMQHQIILSAQADRQKKLKELMHLMSYLKSIEQLKEKRFEEYKAEALHEEQKSLDEIGLQLTIRNQREKP